MNGTATPATTSAVSTASPPPSATSPIASYPSSHRPYRTVTQLDSTIQEEDELTTKEASTSSTPSSSKSTPAPSTPISRDFGLLPAIADPTSRPKLSLKTSQESLASERFAVLLSKDLWKPDNHSTQCDTLGCPSRFGFLGGSRRHHCRKCGGVFCSACSSQTTKLIDTTGEDFIIPPFGHDLSDLPSIVARVCDACHAALNGLRRPSLISLNSSIASSNVPDLVDSPTSLKDTPLPTVSTAPKPPVNRPHMRRSHSYSTESPSGSASPRPHRKRHHSTRQRPSTANSALAPTRTPSPSSTTSNPNPSTDSKPRARRPDLGLLETYPLKDSSAMSKRSGSAICRLNPCASHTTR
jgi:hypothetical protein